MTFNQFSDDDAKMFSNKALNANYHALSATKGRQSDYESKKGDAHFRFNVKELLTVH